MVLPYYEVIEKLGETLHSAIYKVYHKSNPDRLLILKVLKAIFLSEQRKNQLRQRTEHLKVLTNPILITPIAVDVKDGTCFITQDYFNGVTLDKLIKPHSGISLNDFFTVSCKMVQALEAVHKAGIIHGGIKPHNVLVDPGTLEIRLTDFISAVDVTDVSHFIYDPSFVRGTLSYTSPEQTGRISHRVDFSSDMYSLGIVFYELLTGELPFLSDDPLELIHLHLAEEAPEVCDVNPEVPPVLSNIIRKLILKEPEKRYQNGSGLLEDLERCRDEYSAAGSIREFRLESSVNTRRVTFISKMVGRDEEAKTILDEYDKVTRGAFRSLFISGFPGIGKTRLIQELQKPIVKHKGYFSSGKFDFYQKNIPYSSLIQAFRNLTQAFLTESDDRVAMWKHRILKAVGNNGKVLTDVIPELEVLLGPQPRIPQLPPVESLKRFHDVFDRYLACLASSKNPLTLFIDDLQWCDTASFDFLATVLANYKDHPYLFLLGAYRHNEVDSSHPLSKLIANAREHHLPLGEIRLGPLEPEHCHEAVSYILDSTLHETEVLSSFISALTEGNPLFVNESLAYLYNEKLLSFDENGQWRWDLDSIRQSSMPTTVVGLFSSKIFNLPPDLVSLLEYCACMGNTFSPDELALIAGISLLEVFERLKPALEQGLLVQNRSQLRFVHDRVQEAVLSAIPAERRSRIHRQIGTRLISAVSGGAASEKMETLENLFALVSHLNLGMESNPDSKTSYFLSDMNFFAGNKALGALAIEAANEYFKLAMKLLPDDCWEEAHYDHTFRIFQKAAKTELMCGNHANSELLLKQLLDHARTDLDRAECLAERTTSLSSTGDFIKAIESANRGLAYFGKAIPESIEEVNKRREELIAEIASKGIDIRKTILDMPFTTDRKSKVESAFYSDLLADLYLCGLMPQVYLVGAQATLHCLEGGMDEAIIYAFAAMGIYFTEREEFDQAFLYEDLTRDLAAKYPNTFAAAKCMNGVAWVLMHSRSHPRDIADYSLKAFQCGKNSGDINTASLSYGPLMWNLQIEGADLSLVEKYAGECLEFSNRYHLPFSASLAEAVKAGWVAPMKKDFVPIPMEETLRRWVDDNHLASAGSYCIQRAVTHYYMGEHEDAARYLDMAKMYLPNLFHNVLNKEWHVFLALNVLKLFERGIGPGSERDLLAEIGPFIKKVEKWASLGPLLKPYLTFLYAELERVTGGFREARSFYLDAIDIANEQNYVLLEGHINECLGEFLLENGQHRAGVYFAEAVRLYRKCHAERKLIRIIENHPEYFEDENTSYIQIEREEPSLYTLHGFDIQYLLKSSRAITAEIEQNTLLKKIMNVVVESSGAQHGYLLMEDKGKLFVRAESHVTEKQAVRTLDRELQEAADICKAIVRYVYRTGEKLILEDASREGLFKDNPEVRNMQLRSVLCLPITKQSRRIGILYLENRLAGSIFTPEKTLMTELLTSQAAIALDNASLFKKHEEIEQALRERESELKLIMDATPALISYVDPQFRYRRVNKSYERMHGRAADEVQGRHIREVLGERAWQAIKPYLERVLAGEEITYQQEFVFRHVGRRWTSVTYVPDFDDSGRVRGFVVHAMDVEKMKEAEDQVKKSLGEKEVLLKEIHHRVKNNLQIIQSMLNLQMPYIKDSQALELFKESQNRVYSMALIHEKLYQSESLAQINIRDYIQSLTANLFLSYGISEDVITPRIYVENVPLDIDMLVPCALIINELVSNSLKHAFPVSSRHSSVPGEIRIELRLDDGNRFRLAVSDNGVGLPEDLDIEKSSSLGLQLVSVLVKQLKGTIDLHPRAPTEFVISFRGSKGRNPQF